MTKIILSDIDGTFLASNKKPTELHAEALKKILDAGLKFAFVSARMPEAIFPITDKLNLPRTAIISYSGAYVMTEDAQVLYDKKIPLDDAKNILAEMKSRWDDISTSIYCGRRWFTEKIDKRIEREISNSGATVEVKNFDKVLAEDVPNKIFVRCEVETCAEMETELGQMFPNLNVVRSAAYLLEVMDKSVSKATGIEILLKHYGLSVADAIAFGDNYNDTEMLKLIPHSVAMGNSPDAIKNLASAVTDSNDDSGIYTYLKKINLI